MKLRHSLNGRSRPMFKLGSDSDADEHESSLLITDDDKENVPAADENEQEYEVQ